MILNNSWWVFREAAESWKRGRETEGGGREKHVWIKGHLIWLETHFPPPLVKSDPSPRCFPATVPLLSQFWECCRSKVREGTTRAHAASFLFHLMRNPTRSDSFLPQQNNRVPLVESLCLSFMPVVTNTLSYTDVGFLFLLVFVLLNYMMR